MIGYGSKEWREQLTEARKHPLNVLARKALEELREEVSPMTQGVPELVAWGLENNVVKVLPQTWQALDPRESLEYFSLAQPRGVVGVLNRLEMDNLESEGLTPRQLAVVLAQEIGAELEMEADRFA